jgi:hypothetical protein
MADFPTIQRHQVSWSPRPRNRMRVLTAILYATTGASGSAASAPSASSPAGRVSHEGTGPAPSSPAGPTCRASRRACSQASSGDRQRNGRKISYASTPAARATAARASQATRRRGSRHARTARRSASTTRLHMVIDHIAALAAIQKRMDEYCGMSA